MGHSIARENNWSRAAGLRRLASILVLFTPAIPCLAFTDMAPIHAQPNALAESEKVLMQGRADDAIARLRAVTAANPNDGHAHLLLCRAYYAEELADRAISECEAALTTLSGDSKAQDWMGMSISLVTRL